MHEGPPRIVAIANQKGGVGKTTTAINVAAGLAELGAKVLLIDLDPQGNASTGLGLSGLARTSTIYDVLMDGRAIEEVVRPTEVAGLHLCPASGDLSSADIELVSNERRSFLLRDALRLSGSGEREYDFVLIDCPPSLNMLTVNALVAADSVLVPLQAEFFALEGLSQIMTTIRNVRQTANPALRIEGIVITMSDNRNRLSTEVEADVRTTLGDLVFRTTIPRNVRLSEAPSHGLPVLGYDSTSKGAAAYRALSREILMRHDTAGRSREVA